MKAVVTGAGGFIGSSLVEQLLAEGYHVRGVDNFNNYYDKAIKKTNLLTAIGSPRFELVKSDLKTEVKLKEIVGDVDFVFHLAGQPGVRTSWGADFSNYVGDNVLATQRLLEACVGVPSIKKIVNSSSSSVYGTSESRSTAEERLPQPISPYGISKLAAEHLCSAYASELGLPTVSLRYFTVYGPRQRPDMAIHRLLRCAINGEPFTLWGDGSYKRDFTFVADVVRANILSATQETHPGAVFNVGGGEPIAMNRLIELVESTTDVQIKVRRAERQLGDPSSTSADASKIREHLGWAKLVSIEDGLLTQFNAMTRDGTP